MSKEFLIRKEGRASLPGAARLMSLAVGVTEGSSFENGGCAFTGPDLVSAEVRVSLASVTSGCGAVEVMGVGDETSTDTEDTVKDGLGSSEGGRLSESGNKEGADWDALPVAMEGSPRRSGRSGDEGVAGFDDDENMWVGLMCGRGDLGVR
jgi:hypothetical protein